MQKLARISFVSAMVILLIMAACGGSGENNQTNTENTPLTSAQAEQLGTTVFTMADAALSSAMGVPTVVNGGGTANAVRRNDVRPSTMSCSGTTCTITGNYTCPHGGSIAVSGSINQTSSTSVSGTITESPASCSDGTLVIGGRPNMTLGLQGSDNGTTTSVTMSFGGGVGFAPVQAGQFPTGGCSLNINAVASVSDQTGTLTSCTITGSICGMSVNETCTDIAVP